MNSKLDKNFINWLVGFFEAEGSLTIVSRGDLQIVITQGYKNISTLYLIKEALGFGRVVKQGPTTFRYIIQDRDSIITFLGMLYNRIVLNHKLIKYNDFVSCSNSKFNLNMPLQNKVAVIDLENSWLSGFTDGDGCFNVSYILTKKKFKFRFILSQQCDLSFLIKIFPQGACEYNNSNRNHDFVITSLDKSKDFKFKEVIEYFQKFPLKTTKNNSFYLWQYIINQLNFTKMDSNKLAAMKILSKLINE